MATKWKSSYLSVGVNIPRISLRLSISESLSEFDCATIELRLFKKQALPNSCTEATQAPNADHYWFIAIAITTTTTTTIASS